MIHSLPQLVAHLRPRLFSRFRVLYQPEYAPAEHFDSICRLAKEVTELTLAIDEVQELCKGASWMPEDLAFLARCGRHRGISLLWSSQRPAYVARGLTSLSENLKVFRLSDRSDLGYMRDLMPSETVNRLPMLPDRYYFARDASYQWNLQRSP